MKKINFDLYIKSHSDWKRMVESAFRDGDFSGLPAEVYAHDDKCQLGAWIYNTEANNKELANDDLFQLMKQRHKDFHQLAYEIIKLKNAAKFDEALGKTSAFYDSSLDVVECLEELQNRQN